MRLITFFSINIIVLTCIVPLIFPHSLSDFFVEEYEFYRHKTRESRVVHRVILETVDKDYIDSECLTFVFS